MRAAAVAATLIAAVSAASLGRAQDAGLDVDALVTRARGAEESGDPRAAREAWAAVVEAAPSSRQATRARTRIAWLDARSEGGFEPLATVLRFRATPITRRDAGAIDALDRATSEMPDGRVRVEARQLVAGEWLRVGEPERAVAAYRALLDDPSIEPAARAVARQDLAQALDAAGRRDEALALLAGEPTTSGIHARLMRDRRRAIAVPIAIGVLVSFGLVALFLSWPGLRRDARGALRRGLAANRVIAALWVTVVPWLIARAYDEEASDTFALLAMGCAIVLSMASISGAAIEAPRRRGALALATVLAVLAVGYLVGDREASLLGFAG